MAFVPRGQHHKHCHQDYYYCHCHYYQLSTILLRWTFANKFEYALKKFMPKPEVNT